jgi:glycerol-3-phosphate acyltransferase PlsY
MIVMAVVMVILAYLLGSVPTGYLIGLLAGVDVRYAGSGNIGATNVARVVGKRQGTLTLVADATKGLIPVLVASQLGMDLTTTALAGAAAFLGHLYPVFLKFRGGKGVATALGVLLAMAPAATLVLMVVFAVVMLSSRIVSLSSIVTAAAAPVVLWLFSSAPAAILMAGFLAVMILLRHGGNIRRLLAGTEPRFGANSQ